MSDPNSDVETLPPFYTEAGYENVIEELGDFSTLALLAKKEDITARELRYKHERLVVRDCTVEPNGGFALGALHRRILALRDGRGIQGLEQMVSYSVPDRVVVSRYAGTALYTLPSSTIRQIGEAEWGNALTALESATESGLCLDTGSPDNTLYRKQSGITFIDYLRAVDEGLSEPLKPAIDFCDALSGILWEIPAAKNSGLKAAWRQTSQKALEVLNERYPDASAIPGLSVRLYEIEQSLTT